MAKDKVIDFTPKTPAKEPSLSQGEVAALLQRILATPNPEVSGESELQRLRREVCDLRLAVAALTAASICHYPVLSSDAGVGLRQLTPEEKRGPLANALVTASRKAFPTVEEIFGDTLQRLGLSPPEIPKPTKPGK